MFELLMIKKLDDNVQRLQVNEQHCMSFQLFYTLKSVPDSFTGIVYRKENDGAFYCAHFNDPKGNSRKVIALKNKLKSGVFEGIKVILFAVCAGQNTQYPLSDTELAALAAKGA